jgi:CBS domain-containing protein
MNVLAVMTRKVKFSGLDATVADVARIMADNGCGAIPIVDDAKKVVGIVTDRDVCLAMANARRLPSEIPVDQVMTKAVAMCGPDDGLEAALQTMENRRVRRLPVVSGDGTLIGILSVDDVVLRVQSGRQKAELPPDETLKRLRAILRRPISQKTLVVAP